MLVKQPYIAVTALIAIIVHPSSKGKEEEKKMEESRSGFLTNRLTLNQAGSS